MQIPFRKLKVGDQFIHGGTRYQRIKKQEIPRYGIVNAKQHQDEPPAYEGDNGHRFFYHDRLITPQEEA